MRPGGRTRPLRCFAIRGLSSDSLALRDMEVIRSSISSLMSMALLAWVHDFVLLGLHNIFCRMEGVLAESRIWCKKVPFFTPFCLHEISVEQRARGTCADRKAWPSVAL